MLARVLTQNGDRASVQTYPWTAESAVDGTCDTRGRLPSAPRMRVCGLTSVPDQLERLGPTNTGAAVRGQSK